MSGDSSACPTSGRCCWRQVGRDGSEVLGGPQSPHACSARVSPTTEGDAVSDVHGAEAEGPWAERHRGARDCRSTPGSLSKCHIFGKITLPEPVS